MELWLLAAGAAVLVAIALWIVWPARQVDSNGTPVQSEEVSRQPMTESVRRDLTPQGDRFEDQYTSATADLSAGGVAAAFSSPQEAAPTTPHSVPTQEPVPSTRGQRWPEASAAGEPIGQASREENFPYSTASDDDRGLIRPKTLGIGAGTLVALGSAVGGVWLYTRWQHERNKPINRLRRSAREMASRVGERLPEVDELPAGTPIGGAASALLLAALLGSRALQRKDPADQANEVADGAREFARDAMKETRAFGRDVLTRENGREFVKRGRDAVDRDALKKTMSRGADLVDSGRKTSRRWASRLPTDRLPDVEPRRPAIFGLGFGGLAVVGGGSYLIWRLLRGGRQNSQPTWYGGE